MSNIEEIANSLDIDWAELIDLFASEYGWTIDDIKKLDMGQIIILSKQIKKRYERQNQANNQDMPQQDISPGENGIPTSDFITKMGGKLKTDEDGTKRIVV